MCKAALREDTGHSGDQIEVCERGMIKPTLQVLDVQEDLFNITSSSYSAADIHQVKSYFILYFLANEMEMERLVESF